MKNIRLNIITALTALSLCLFAPIAKATQLPDENITFLKSKFPEIQIRFDGLVELPDHTIYLPVIPLEYTIADKPSAILKTIPANTDFSKKPDMILFANNLALLKVVKYGKDQLTVNYSQEIPLSVKLGILPQDLIVPKGLILPTELKVIMGNLKIAVKQKKDEGDLVFYGQPKQETTVDFSTRKAPQPSPAFDFIKNKGMFTASFKDNKINIIDAKTGNVFKSMKLPTIPSNMALTANGKYLLISSSKLNKVFVIDTFTNLFLKEIEVGQFPKSIAMSENSERAYVANKVSSTITEIKLGDMAISKTIPVNGRPDNLCISDDKDTIFYNDEITGNIYSLNTKNQSSTPLFQANSISKILQYKNFLYVLSRQSNELTVFDLKPKTDSEKEYKPVIVKTGEKPVDMAISAKRDLIYILASASNEINVIDIKDNQDVQKIQLSSEGFPGSITVLDKESKAIVTYCNLLQMDAINLEKASLSGSIPVTTTVSFLQVLK